MYSKDGTPLFIDMGKAIMFDTKDLNGLQIEGVRRHVTSLLNKIPKAMWSDGKAQEMLAECLEDIGLETHVVGIVTDAAQRRENMAKW